MIKDRDLVTAIVFMKAPGQTDPTVKKYRNIKDRPRDLEKFLQFVRRENKYLHHINLYSKVSNDFIRQIPCS